MCRKPILAALVAGALGLTPAALGADDLEIKSFSAGSATCEDYTPEVAASPGGSFLLVWSRYCEGSTTYELAARPYDAEARPIGPEVELGEGFSFTLAALPGGGYALAWIRSIDSFHSELYLQRLDARGRPSGTPFAVNQDPSEPSFSFQPRLAVDRAGRLALLWQRQESLPYRFEFLLRRFNADLTPASEVLSFSDRLPYGPESPDLAFAENGDLLVAWEQFISEHPSQYTAIFGRRFPVDGSAPGPSFRITWLDSGDHRAPRLLAAPYFGGWLMAWQRTDFLGKSDARFAYLPEGTVQLGQTSGTVIDPSREGRAEAALATDVGGGILVLSENYQGPLARRLFDPIGFPAGEPVEVAPFGVWGLDGPALSRSPTGSFLAVWAEAARVEFDIDVFLPQAWDLRGRIFRRECPAIGGKSACLLSERFGVQVSRGLGAATIYARPTVLDDGGVLFAFPGRIPEVAVRMTQNGAAAELVYAATTNSELSIQVFDRPNSRITTTEKPAGRFASGRLTRLGDLAAAPASPAAPAISETAALATAPPLSLFGDRFKVEVSWTGADGTIQRASGALFDDRRAAFRFGKDLSLTVALIDGRASNGKFWVYLGDLSDAAHRVKITDSATGKVKVYNKPAGRLLTRVDRQAF